MLFFFFFLFQISRRAEGGGGRDRVTGTRHNSLDEEKACAGERQLMQTMANVPYKEIFQKRVCMHCLNPFQNNSSNTLKGQKGKGYKYTNHKHCIKKWLRAKQNTCQACSKRFIAVAHAMQNASPAIGAHSGSN